MFPNHRKAYEHDEKLRRKSGKYLELDSTEDAFNWWCSGISKKKFGRIKQLKFPYWDEVALAEII
ncbi:MAG: hypothetical protein ACLTZT_00095 [Butyricimonas faecalis]